MGSSDELLAKLLAMKAQEKPTDKDILCMLIISFSLTKKKEKKNFYSNIH